MVSRVAFLCNKKKENITSIEDELAMVTFTNDAAINMKVRLKQMFVNYYILTSNECYLQYVESVDRASISTIHKFALQLLRGASFYTGLGTNFRISSDEYNRGKIYDIYLSEFLKLKEEESPNFISEIPVPIYDLKKKIIGIADQLLQKSINLADIKPEEMGVTIDNTLPYFNELIQKVIFPAEIEYLEAVNARNAMDLKECIILLNKVLNFGAGNINNLKLRYLFVDEFQDTDDVQIEVLQKLQNAIVSGCRLFVVGDLKQSIYRFRGARLSAFDQLKTYQKYEWEIHHLNINYRTDSRLLDIYDGIFQKMGANGYLPYTAANDRLTSEKIFYHLMPEHFEDYNQKVKEAEMLLNSALLRQLYKKNENGVEINLEKNAKKRFETYLRLILLFSDSRFQISQKKAEEVSGKRYKESKEDICRYLFKQPRKYLYEMCLKKKNPELTKIFVEEVSKKIKINGKTVFKAGYKRLDLEKSMFFRLRDVEHISTEKAADMIEQRNPSTKERYEQLQELNKKREEEDKLPNHLFFDRDWFCNLAAKAGQWNPDFIDSLMLFYQYNELVMKLKKSDSKTKEN